MSSTYFTDSVSDLCQGIVDKADTYEKRIKYLEEENKKLKDEHYKDSEMQRMEAELKKAKEDLYRGFPISEKEQEKIREWELKHDAEKHGLKTMEQREWDMVAQAALLHGALHQHQSELLEK